MPRSTRTSGASEPPRDQRRLTAMAIRHAREWQGMDRQEFADALSRERGETWTVNMVAKLETGQKPCALDLLTSIQKIQGRDYDWYFKGPFFEGRVSMGQYGFAAPDLGLPVLAPV